MDYREFKEAIDRMKVQAVKEHRRRIVVSVVLLLVTAAFLLGGIALMGFGDPVRLIVGVVAVLAVAAIQFRRAPPTFPALDRALLTADVGSAVEGADGSIACLCAEGVILTSERRVIAFDRDRERIESISWEEEGHALRLQVWQLLERRRQQLSSDYETITTYRVQLPPSLSPDDALAVALSWEKYRWHVRETGAPPPLS